MLTRIKSESERQWRELQPIILVILGVAALVFGTLVILRAFWGIPIAEFTRDPLGYTEHPWHKGAVSNLGIMIWSAAAAVCYFAWAVGNQSIRNSIHAQFLLAGGILTTVLALDDLYMLHEVVFPGDLGIHENIVYATYGLAVVSFIVRFRNIILQFDTLLFVGALFGFGLSIGSDLIAGFVSIPGFYILEDGSKFLGILFWAAFFARAASRHLAIGDTVPAQ